MRRCANPYLTPVFMPMCREVTTVHIVVEDPLGKYQLKAALIPELLVPLLLGRDGSSLGPE